MSYVISLPSYVKETLDFLRTLEGAILPEGATLVAINVEALYLSIPHCDCGLQIIIPFLQTIDMYQQPLNQFILQLLEHILQSNVFTYAGYHYLQVQGVAMGTSCAPSYASLYLGGGIDIFLPGRTCQFTCATS